MTGSYIPNRIIVRGAGDVASGVIRQLLINGYEVIALEKPEPDCVRRMVCFAEAYYEKATSFEGVTGILAGSVDEAITIVGPKSVPVLVDPLAESLADLIPMVVVDARMMKKNIDTTLDMAPIVIGLGPGFAVGENCHVAVETIRGEHLGRVIYAGSPRADTGIPADVEGISAQRVLRSPTGGKFKSHCQIGDQVEAGMIIGDIDGTEIIAEIGGIVRGIIHDGLKVNAGHKIGDIDPRGIKELCYKISDKANAIGRGVAEAIHSLRARLSIDIG